MITISKYLTAEQVLCRSKLNSKKRALQTIGQLLATHTPELADDIYDAILKRERLGSTAIGNGIVIPHARVKDLPQPEIAAITLAEPIDFDTPDDKPVDIIVGLAVPEASTEEHLEILAGLSSMLASTAFLQQLRDCKNKAELYNVFMVRTATHA